MLNTLYFCLFCRINKSESESESEQVGLLAHLHTCTLAQVVVPLRTCASCASTWALKPLHKYFSTCTNVCEYLLTCALAYFCKYLSTSALVHADLIAQALAQALAHSCTCACTCTLAYLRAGASTCTSTCAMRTCARTCILAHVHTCASSWALAL